MSVRVHAEDGSVPPRRSRPLTAAGMHGSVLVAARSPGLRGQICRPLRDHGFAVVEAADAIEALVLSRDFPVDVAVIDVDPPGPGGPEVLDRWRERSPGQDIPIVLVTGRTGLDDVGMSIHLGAHDYLLRPLQAVDVLARVHSALEAKRRLDDFGRRMTELRQLVLTDPLTGLYNRRHMEAELAGLSSAARRRETPLGVLLIDVDRFKRINDRHGHEAGDAALRTVAQRIRSVVRAEDVVGRWGGDEFVVLLPSTDELAARALAERLCGEIAVSGNGDGTTLPITVSVGCTAGSGPAGLELVAMADTALRRAKAGGRNRVAVESPRF